ncbi:MAG TPA: hypothetical protein VKY73_04920 [Polyangiaceae bacterium]|nr:hypothetical protein [Polyangiaceae bacterium]
MVAGAPGRCRGSPDTSDGVHPTPAGAQKTTDVWHDALISVL